MKILISGSSGFIGKTIKIAFDKKGYEFCSLVRRRPVQKNEFFYDPLANEIDEEAFKGASAVINLSGESIYGIWTDRKKKKIFDSRVLTTKFLVDKAIKSKSNLTFVSASAVGFYGYEDYFFKDETNEKGNGFLSNVCSSWENAAKAFSPHGRVVLLRFGIVIGKKGGMLKKILPLYKMGLGGIIGKGIRPLSWIAIDEIPEIIEFVLRNESISGPINCTSPEVVTYKEFNDILKTILNKPAFLKVPTSLVIPGLGQMGKELLLGGVRAVPKRLNESGYIFFHPNLKEYLKNIIS